MLKSKIPNNDIILRTEIFSEDFSSDRDFYNQKLLDFSTNSVINDVIDSEIYEYKPELTNELNFNIFFLRYVQDSEYDILKNYMEPGFQTQHTNSKKNFGLINDFGVEIPKSFNNVFETKQSNGLRDTPVLIERNLTKFQELKQKPYFVKDIIGESTLKKPTKSGIPIFYNSFTLPFWDGRDRWLNESLLYSNKPYFRNSFLLLEFYDSPFSINQNRIQSIPIFVNDRYNITERNITKNFDYERPCFKLTNGVEGYSFFFLNNYVTNEFYVRYSFWDALNGKKISLLPSSNINQNKKWLQDPNNFNQNTRYLKYVLDYGTKTYKIYEYNTITNEFDTERSDFDLYELEFDDYYRNRIIPNETPVDSRTQIVTTELKNPFNFTIKNLHTNSFIGDGGNTYVRLSQQEIDNSPSFLNITKNFIETFNTYIGNVKVDIFGDLPKKEMTLPVIDRKITGYQVLLKSFLFKNEDTETWTIRNIEFRDINISLDGVNLNNVYYNQRQSLWNEKPSFRISEAITLLNSNSVFNLSYGTKEFTEEIVYTYLDDANVFRELLKLIERERRPFSVKKGNNNTGKIIKIFLDECFKTLKVKYDETHKKTTYYSGYAYQLPLPKQLNPLISTITNLVTKLVEDSGRSEIFNYIDRLVVNYDNLKTTNPQKFNEIKFLAISLLVSYKNLQNKGLIENTDVNISGGLVNYINTILTPNDNQELINKYILLTTQKNLTLNDKNKIEKVITKNSLGLILDKPATELGYEPRDYVLETFVIQNGDKFIKPNESNKIDFYFNIGEKVKFLTSNLSEIVVSGRLRMSIINNSGNIKNIVVPIKSTIKTKPKEVINISKILAKYKASKPEPGNNINQLTLIKK